MSAPATFLGLATRAGVIAAAVLIAYAVLMPCLRALAGRGKRARRSTLDRLERQADEQPAVRIIVVDAAGRRAIEPVRLAGTRTVDGASAVECIHDDGRITFIDSTAIVAIDEL